MLEILLKNLYSTLFRRNTSTRQLQGNKNCKYATKAGMWLVLTQGPVNCEVLSGWRASTGYKNDVYRLMSVEENTYSGLILFEIICRCPGAAKTFTTFFSQKLSQLDLSHSITSSELFLIVPAPVSLKHFQGLWETKGRQSCIYYFECQSTLSVCLFFY